MTLPIYVQDTISVCQDCGDALADSAGEAPHVCVLPANHVHTNDSIANHHISAQHHVHGQMVSDDDHDNVHLRDHIESMHDLDYHSKLHRILPPYQRRQNKMLSILHEYETLPLYLVSGFIREIGIEFVDELIIPQELIRLCFTFYQHQDMAKLIDSCDCDQLYCLAWEATENEEYLFAEQLITYLLQHRTYHHHLVHDHDRDHEHSKRAMDTRNSTILNMFKLSCISHKTMLKPLSSMSSLRKYSGMSSASCVSEDASTTNLMAVIKYFMRDYQESERFFKMASLIDPHCDIILNNYAVLLLEQERYLEAEETIMAAIRCNPRCIKNHQQYAYILFTMGKYELAAKECQLMILLQPNIESYSGYAWLLEQMGKFKQSAASYQQLIHLEPQNAVWYFWYAVLLQRCDAFEESMCNFEKCLALDANYEVANGNYAYSLYLNGKYQSALKYIQVALQKNTDCSHLCVHFYYALIMIQFNRIQTAVNELYHCLDLIQLPQRNRCKHEKGCLPIHEHHIYNLLSELGYN